MPRNFLPGLLICCLPCLGQVDSVPLRSTRTITAGYAAGGDPIARWNAGTLLSVENARSAAPEFKLFDRSGKPLSSFRLVIPGASLINVYSGRFSSGPGGAIAVAGSAFTKDSRGSSFLAWISPDRAEQNVIQITPFAPVSVVIASDGTIWTAGSEGGEFPDPNTAALRRYHPSGRLLGAWFPLSSLKIKNRERFADGAQYSSLSANGEYVAWYADSVQTLFLFNLDGSERQRLPVSYGSEMRLRGIALCADGTAYSEVKFESTASPSNPAIYVIPTGGGAPKLRFLPNRHGPVHGCDGRELVVSAAPNLLSWLQP